MKTNRLLSVLLIIMMLGVGSVVTFRATAGGIPLPTRLNEWGIWADVAVEQQLKDIPLLEQLAPSLLLKAGASEQDGIFITQDYLLENIKPGAPSILEGNLRGIEEFLENISISTAVMIIPTACAIKQEEIPQTAQIYNQKAMISEAYGRLAGKTTTIDAYTALFGARAQYTYYRTEANLTGLGGYYVYTALAQKLGITPRALNQFQIEHPSSQYFGELHQRSSFKGTTADIVTIYDFWRFERQYKVTHGGDGLQRTYYTLFPRHMAQLGRPMDVVLGGFSPRIDVAVASPYEQSMLIIADETVLSYLPFLLVHYGNATILDLTRTDTETLMDFNMGAYDSVLFAFSAESITNLPVSASAGLLGA